MPVVVCSIEKKRRSPSDSTVTTPRSDSPQYDRASCNARVAGYDADCHSPPVGQLFRDATPSSRSNSSLVDFNQVNSIFENLFSHLRPLLNFKETLNHIIASGHMSSLSGTKKQFYKENIAIFNKNIEALVRLRDLCAKDVSNLDVSDIWQILLQNYRTFSLLMQDTGRVDENIRSVSHCLNELQELLTVEEKKLEVYQTISATRESITSDREALIAEKIATMRSRISCHEQLKFPSNDKFSEAITHTLSLDISFLSEGIVRTEECLEWYKYVLEIEEQFFRDFPVMHRQIEELSAQLRMIQQELETRANHDDALIEREWFIVEDFIKNGYQRVFSFKNFDENIESFSQDFRDSLDSNFEMSDYCAQLKISDDFFSRQVVLEQEQGSRVASIKHQIDLQREKKNLLVESKATLALCQFYNSKHIMPGKEQYCYLFADMNKAFARFSRQFNTNRITLEQSLFLKSKYLFPLALIERLNQAKQLMCDLQLPNGIRRAILMPIKDLLEDLKRTITAKSHGLLHSSAFKTTCRQAIEFLDRAEQVRLTLSQSLRDLEQLPTIAEVLFDDEGDYLERSKLFVLAELNHPSDDKTPLVISHANYVDSDLIFLCLHYLNYAWGYAHRPNQLVFNASPVLIYVINDDVERFSNKLREIFNDVSKNIIQIIFVFGNIHFVGGCLRTFAGIRKFAFLDSGDMPLVPMSHLLAVQGICNELRIEFDDQIGQRKQIGANCAFIAVETLAFLSQPNLAKDQFSAVSVSEYIARATGATRALQTIQTNATPDRILSPEAQAYTDAVRNFMFDGRFRLRVRWALFAQQAYDDQWFQDNIKQSLNDTLSFNNVILDPELQVSADDVTPGERSEFLERMTRDCFPLPGIPLIVIPPRRVSSSSSSSSTFSSSSSSSSSSLGLGGSDSFVHRVSAAASQFHRTAAHVASSAADFIGNLVPGSGSSASLLSDTSLQTSYCSSSSSSGVALEGRQTGRQTPVSPASLALPSTPAFPTTPASPVFSQSPSFSNSMTANTPRSPSSVVAAGAPRQAQTSASLNSAILDGDYFGRSVDLSRRAGVSMDSTISASTSQSFSPQLPLSPATPLAGQNNPSLFSPDSMLSPVTPPLTGQTVMRTRPTFSTGSPPSPISTSTNLQQGRDLSSSSAPPSPTTPVILQQPPTASKKKGWGEWMFGSRYPHHK